MENEIETKKKSFFLFLFFKSRDGMIDGTIPVFSNPSSTDGTDKTFNASASA